MLSRVMATLTVAMAFTLAGCGGLDGDGAADLARAFVEQASQDPAAACALLAPTTKTELEQNSEKSCPAALGELGIEPAAGTPRVQAFGSDAQVALANQTVFLSRFNDGWKVVAAGCTSSGTDPDVPYTCPLKGR